MERLVRAAVKDNTAKESQKLSQTLHQLQVSNELLHHENNGLGDALTAKKQRKNAGKPLGLQRKEEYHSGATFWSPSKFERACEHEVEKQHQEEQERLAKSNKKELQAAAKLLREQEKEERCVAIERAKEVQDQMKAKQVAAREARKAAQNTRQASTITQRGKRKALKAPLAERKPKQAKCGVAACPVSPEAAPAPLPKVNTRGRAIQKPSRDT
jgi:hypothetical protein